ncbi:MAG: glycosyltransferase family 4 protein [Chloroflexi bacterium]|nr:glycosyltransferase family 4 protein [Chloroflexota bacterium]
MRVAIVTSRYPSEENPHVYAFVHIRAKEYIKKGINVDIFVPSKTTMQRHYDGITVQYLPAPQIPRLLERSDVVMSHLLHISYQRERDGSHIYEWLLREQWPFLYFIHGIEVQKIAVARPERIIWWNPYAILAYLYHDFYLIPKMRHFLIRLYNEHPRFQFVAVSRWMLDEVKRNLDLDFTARAKVIPNGINTKLFVFKDRWKDRHRLLTIRPLHMKGKYALDLALETMRYLSPPITLDIYGSGPDEAKIRRWIQAHGLNERIRLTEGFVPHTQLPQIHEGHGIYYAVTRMDAQGVTMCEAMASGLPVVSFAICGIPEFVHHGKTGILIEPYNVRQAAEAIQRLTEDRDLYQRLAEGARRFIETIDIERTTEQEIALAQSLL